MNDIIESKTIGFNFLTFAYNTFMDVYPVNVEKSSEQFEWDFCFRYTGYPAPKKWMATLRLGENILLCL